MTGRDRRFLTHLLWSGAIVLVAAGALGLWARVPFLTYLTPHQHFVLQLETTKDVPSITSHVVFQAVAVTRMRIFEMGLTGASVSEAPGDRIVVDVRASAADTAKLRAVLTDPGRLEFKICPGTIRSYAGCGAVVATAADIQRAHAGFDHLGEPQVLFFTRNERKFGRLTQPHIGQYMAIYFDGTAIGGGTIEGAITGAGSIHGKFTKDQVATIAMEMNTDPLPVPVRIVEPK